MAREAGSDTSVVTVVVATLQLLQIHKVSALPLLLAVRMSRDKTQSARVVGAKMKSFKAWL